MVDNSSNIYVTGYVQGGLLGETFYGNEDPFLVKYNSDGNNQWTRHLGSDGTDQGIGVTVDSSNNIYVTGNSNPYGNVDLSGEVQFEWSQTVD